MIAVLNVAMSKDALKIGEITNFNQRNAISIYVKGNFELDAWKQFVDSTCQVNHCLVLLFGKVPHVHHFAIDDVAQIPALGMRAGRNRSKV